MTELCNQPGCEQPKGRARGLCNGHYLRLTRGKDMNRPIRKHGATDAERFWAKVQKTEACWVWTGANMRGYGVFNIGGRNHVAHRVAYQWAHGPIPDGAEVDHMCFTRSCVNVSHLRLLTHSLNGQNRASANSNSRSGVRGVYWVEARRGWMGAAMLNRTIHRVGPFSAVREADEAISAWRREHMPASINDRRKVE